MASIDAARGATVHSHTDRRTRLRDTWPLHWRHVGQLVAAYVALTAVFVGIGELITHPFEDSALVRRDLRIEQWFADHRTAGLNRASFWGSQLSETGTKIVVTALVGIAVLVLFKRWYEALLIAVPLVLEAAAFLTITLVVGRPRPDVPRLDGSPVGSSFPSGHTAAAACYAGIVVVVALHHHHRWIWSVGLAVVAAITATVGWARMYRGMHHLTDVVAGAQLGTVAVVVATVIVRRAEQTRRSRSGDPVPVAPARKTSTVLVVGVLLAVMAVVGVVVWWATRSAVRADPADVRVADSTARDAVVEHPGLARLLRRRIDPATASGLALTLAAVVAVLGVLGVGTMFEMVQRNAGLARLDSSAARFGATRLSPATERLFKIVTQFGGTWVVVALAVVVLVIEHRRVPSRKIVWFFLVAIGGTVAITNLVKVLVDRARPDIARLVGASGPSFPSGHSSSAAVAYAAFALVLGRGQRRRVKALLAAVAAVRAAAVATSRVLLGVHWLTDVIAGVALGWGWFAVSSIMFGGRMLEFGRPVEQLQEQADDVAPRQRTST